MRTAWDRFEDSETWLALRVIAFVATLIVVGLSAIFAVAAVIYTVTERPSCLSRGEKMALEVEWGFWPGCMVRVQQGQWLPWSEVVPVLRDGKVAFEPKPQPVIVLKDK